MRATAVHVVNYVRLAPELALADWRTHVRGALTRRTVVVGSLVLVLAVAMLPFPNPFPPGNGG